MKRIKPSAKNPARRDSQYRIAVAFGTRPEALKLSMVIRALRKSANLKPVVVVTAQHREMLDQVLEIFEINPAYDLDIMTPNQTLFELTAKMVPVLGELFTSEKPELVLVQGDTTTAFAAALAAFYLKIPVAHVEAGLRSYEKYQPFPEEINRQLTDALAEIHFAPTPVAKANLLSERVPGSSIYVTGNTIIDTLFWILKTTKSPNWLIPENEFRRILVTAHRRENWDIGIEGVCRAIIRVVEKYRNVEVVFSCHLNPRVQNVVISMLSGRPRVKVINPIGYTSFVHLINSSYLILTDSGGIQEEAPSLGKPVLLTRNVTERPEGIENGVTRLVGIDENKIFREITLLMDNPEEYGKMAKTSDIYGDGKTSQRIVNILTKRLLKKELSA